MKEAELRKHATCSCCGKRIGHSGVPLFWTVTVQRFGVDLNACMRADGLGSFLGSPALAAIMGPDEDLAMPVMDPAELTLCEPCAIDRTLPIGCIALQHRSVESEEPTR